MKAAFFIFALRFGAALGAALTGVALIITALTVPMVAATAPAVLGIAACVLAFFLYPRREEPSQ